MAMQNAPRDTAKKAPRSYGSSIREPTPRATMKPITTINGYTVLSTGCCGSQVFAVARPNNTIMKRDFFTEEDATNYILSITNGDKNGAKTIP